MSFQGKTIWITGASSGIGAGLAEAFAREGGRLILSGRNREALAEVAARVQPTAHLLPFEATDWAALPRVAADAGPVDVLVNNAGISQRSLAVDTRPDVYTKLIETDLLAPIWLTQLVLPAMVARRSGHIIGISSVAGRIGAVLRTGYSAAKHGLIGYLDALRAEVEDAYGIRVTTVLPGSVRTQVAANALLADGAARGESDPNIDAGMEPAECARRILAGIAGGQREIIVADGGEALVAGMRFTAPEQLFDMLAKEGARLAAERAKGGRPEPATVKQFLGP
ncbi:MAG: SDR family NAD(P)-dependent oxidoreductase [Proteobacteria bacterium]|nr:SDR family NAD(P)-dependent oxidoreductase [Pseudomonadota bacterium]